MNSDFGALHPVQRPYGSTARNGAQSTAKKPL